MMRSAFPTIILLFVVIRAHSGDGLNLKVVGDAIIIEANHVPDPSSSSFFDNTVPQVVVKVGPEGTLQKFTDDALQDESREATTESGSLQVDGLENDEGTGIPYLEEPGSNWTTAYPWLTSIVKNKKQICTGTLIDSRHVLTSAYCLYNLTAEDLAEVEVDIGYEAMSISKFRQYALNRGPFITLKVNKTIRHIRFNPATAYNDIGLLQLICPVVSYEAVEPIQLEGEGAEADGNVQHIIGWRDGVDLEGESVEYWRDQESRGVSLDDCRKNYGYEMEPQGISPEMICSGGLSDGTSCRWKFGTPLISQPKNESSTDMKQIGIFSWGSEAMFPKCRFSETNPYPMVFTRISSYMEWIQRNIKH